MCVGNFLREREGCACIVSRLMSVLMMSVLIMCVDTGVWLL